MLLMSMLRLRDIEKLAPNYVILSLEGKKFTSFFLLFMLTSGYFLQQSTALLKDNIA